MKSIREWMKENGSLSEDFDKNDFARYMGSTSFEVNRDLELELRPKVRRIMDMEKFRSMPAEDLLDRMKAVISQTVAGMSGSFLGTRTAAKNLGSDEGEKVDATRFARMMGGEKVEVDAELRRELKPKIERIMDENNKKESPLPKAELERDLIAVVSKLVAGLSGTTVSVGAIDSKFDAMGDDAIAKESVVPEFQRWVEENDAEQGAVSEPQHEVGEKDMDLQAAVEKRLMQMASDLETKGKGSRQQILAAIKAVVDSAGKGEQNAPPQDPQGPQGQGQQTPPQDAGQPQQPVA